MGYRNNKKQIIYTYKSKRAAEKVRKIKNQRKGRKNFMVKILGGSLVLIAAYLFGMKLMDNENKKFNVLHIVVKYLNPYLEYSVLFALFLFMLKIAGREKVQIIGAGYVWKIISMQGLSVLWYLPCIVLIELIFIYVNKFYKNLLIPISVGIYLSALFF